LNWIIFWIFKILITIHLIGFGFDKFWIFMVHLTRAKTIENLAEGLHESILTEGHLSQSWSKVGQRRCRPKDRFSRHQPMVDYTNRRSTRVGPDWRSTLVSLSRASTKDDLSQRSTRVSLDKSQPTSALVEGRPRSTKAKGWSSNPQLKISSSWFRPKVDLS